MSLQSPPPFPSSQQRVTEEITVRPEPTENIYQGRESDTNVVVAEQEPYFGLISFLLCILCFPFGLILLFFPLDTRPLTVTN